MPTEAEIAKIALDPTLTTAQKRERVSALSAAESAATSAPAPVAAGAPVASPSTAQQVGEGIGAGLLGPVGTAWNLMSPQQRETARQVGGGVKDVLVDAPLSAATGAVKGAVKTGKDLAGIAPDAATNPVQIPEVTVSGQAGVPVPEVAVAAKVPRRGGGGGVRRRSGNAAENEMRRRQAAEDKAAEKQRAKDIGYIPSQYTDREEFLQKQREAEAEQAAHDAFYAEEEAQKQVLEEAKKKQLEIDAAEAEHNQKMLELQEKMQRDEDSFREMADAAASQKIDANSFFAKRSTGENIVATLGMILAGAAGGPDGAKWGIQRMERLIDQDIDIQLKNKQMMQNRLAAQGKLVAMARDRYAGAAEISAASKEAAMRRIKAELERFAAFASTPVRQARFQQAMVELDQRIAEAERQRRLANETEFVQERALRAKAMMGGGRVDPRKKYLRDLKLTNAVREEEEKLAGGTKGELHVPGVGEAFSSKTRRTCGPQRLNTMPI